MNSITPEAAMSTIWRSGWKIRRKWTSITTTSMGTGRFWMHFNNSRITVKAVITHIEATTHSHTVWAIQLLYPRTLWVLPRLSFKNSCLDCFFVVSTFEWNLYDFIFFSQNSALDGTSSIAAFMNSNTSFKQQYPHLLQRQQSQSPISNDPMTSNSSQQEFLSLPSVGLIKNDKIPSTDQEKLNDVFSQTRR